MNDKERIQLAEAMGKPCSCHMFPDIDMPCKVHDLTDVFGCLDPFTDANDDYAVLEWARNLPETQFSIFMTYFSLNRRMKSWQYQIGDYARAALKVLNQT